MTPRLTTSLILGALGIVVGVLVGALMEWRHGVGISALGVAIALAVSASWRQAVAVGAIGAGVLVWFFAWWGAELGWLTSDVGWGWPWEPACATAVSLAILGSAVLLPPRFARVVFIADLVLFPLALVGVFVGWAEAGILLGGLLILGSTALLPTAIVRVLGAVYLAGVVFVFAHAPLGVAGAILVAAVPAVLAWWLLPSRVHRRVAFMLPSLVLLIFFTTMLMYVAPGNPFQQEKAATEAAIEAQKAKFRVADTALGFFEHYMDGLLAEGFLGWSVQVQGRTVNELLLPALPVSMSLGLLALIFAVTIGLFLGIRAGLKPNSVADYGSMGLAMIGISLPNFVIGAIFLIIFALNLGWLPVAGWGSYGNLLLPALTLALPYAAYIARLARSGTIEVLQQDFIRTARAKGLPERVVVLKHALRGAILPVVSFLGPAAAGIFTGSFVIETLFAIPGMGAWFVNSAINRDYSVVLGTAIIYFTIITLFNLLVDFAYAWLDPRVREEL